MVRTGHWYVIVTFSEFSPVDSPVIVPVTPAYLPVPPVTLPAEIAPFSSTWNVP